MGRISLVNDWLLAMRVDRLVLIKGVSEFVTVLNAQVMTFAFSDLKVRR